MSWIGRSKWDSMDCGDGAFSVYPDGPRCWPDFSVGQTVRKLNGGTIECGRVGVVAGTWSYDGGSPDQIVVDFGNICAVYMKSTDTGRLETVQQHDDWADELVVRL